MIPEQYNIIWTSSWISLYPTILAIYNKKYYLAFGTSSVFITSILYWRNPNNNYTRLLDHMCVRLCCLYQLYYAYKQKKITNYLYINSISATSYYYGYHFYYIKHNYWKYTYCHFTLHIFANLANMYLAIN